MARPTEEDLHHAAGLLEALAYRHDARNNPNGFPDVARLLDFLVWLDTDLEHAKKGAAYGPGGPRSELGGGMVPIHTIGRHGLNRPVEGRFIYPDAMTRTQRGIILRDPLVKALRELRGEWGGQLGSLMREWRFRAEDVANYPQRIPDTG